MELKPIKSEKDYRKALDRLYIIFDAPIDTKLGDSTSHIADSSIHFNVANTNGSMQLNDGMPSFVVTMCSVTGPSCLVIPHPWEQ